MKTNILLLALAVLGLVSCKKDDQSVLFPNPPTEAHITYKVYKSTVVHPRYPSFDSASPNSYTRKITFAYDWREDSAYNIVPMYKDTIVTGDFELTVVGSKIICRYKNRVYFLFIRIIQNHFCFELRKNF